jgi:Na+-transporting NADH:ubiquinone oxidoreductase subunit NqrA
MAQIFKAKTLVSNSGRFAYEVIAPNLVYNTGDQNISGVKNFGSRPTVNGTGVLLIGEASAITLPSTIVYTTGNQIISGNKTFVNNVAISGTGIFSSVKVSNIDKLLLSGIDVVISGNSSVNVYNQIYISGNPVLTGTIPTSQTITNVVYTTGNQTISGTKTFASPIVFSNGANYGIYPGGAGGSINLRGGDASPDGVPARTAGSLNMSASADAGGGSINTAGYDNNGGSINTFGGTNYAGGSINTSEGGGDIDTRGQGQIQFGFDTSRTTLSGTASTNITIYLPNASGTLALDSNVATTGSILNNKINSLSGYINSQDNVFSGQIFNTGSRLDAKINSLSGYVNSQNTIFSGQTASTGSLLDSKINSLSGNLTGNYATIINLFSTGSQLATANANYSGWASNTYATIINLNNTGRILDNKINNLSGYVDSRDILFSGQIASTGSILDNKINALSGVSILTFGDQNIYGNKNFLNNIGVSGTGVFNAIDLNNVDILSISGVDVSIVNGNVSLTNRPIVNGTGVILSGELERIIINSGALLNEKINSLSGYINSQDLIFSGQIASTGSILDNKINALSGTLGTNVVYLTGNQNINGTKNFYNTPTINGDGILSSGQKIIGGDLTGNLLSSTVNKLQGYQLDLNGGAADGQVLQWNAASSSWRAGAVPAGGNGGGGLVYYFDFANRNGIAPTGGLPTTGDHALSLLGREYAVGAGQATSNELDPRFVERLLCSFVTASGNPQVTNIPAGLWDFNIWASVNSASAIQCSIRAVVNIYNPNNSTYRYLASTDDVYLYETDTIAQYILNATVPQTGIQSYERIYIELFGKKYTTNNRNITLYFDSYRPSHVHTTIPSIAGDGVVKVVNGVFQSPATGIFNADVDNAANIAQSKIANLTTDLANLNSQCSVLTTNLISTGAYLNEKINSLSGWSASSGNLFSTGSNLDNKINSLSGYVNSQNITLSGQIFNTGSRLDNKINALSGSAVLTYGNQNIYGIKNFYSGIVITGDGSTNGGYSLVAKNSAGTDGLRFNPTQEGGAGNLYFNAGTTTRLYNVGDSTLQFYTNSNPYRVANSLTIGNGSDIADHTAYVVNKYGYLGIGSGFSNPLERLHVSGGNLRVDGKILLSGNPVLTGVDLSSYATKSAINSLSGQVVFTTGNQTIAGNKNFTDDINLTGINNRIGKNHYLSTDENFVYIRQADGNTILSSEESSLFDLNQINSVAWANRQLYDSNGSLTSLDWNERYLANQLGTPVLYWTGNNIGIGTNTPSEKLTVAGNIKIFDGGNSLYIYDSANGADNRMSWQDNELIFANNYDVDYPNRGEVGFRFNNGPLGENSLYSLKIGDQNLTYLHIPSGRQGYIAVNSDLVNTGIILNNKINALSGSVVLTYGNQNINGIKTFVDNTVFGDPSQGDFLVISGNTFTIYGSGNFTNGLFVSGVPVLTGVDLSSYATKNNLFTTGSILDTKINSLSGYVNSQDIIFSGQTFNTGSRLDSKINSLSGWSASSGNLFSTGSNLDNKINSLSGYINAQNIVFSGQTFNTGSRLDNKINSLSGFINDNVVFKTGNQTILGQKTFSGTTTVIGHFAATSKSFLIDHPLDNNKKLQYASLEGPEHGVFLRGKTNENIINLPNYWSALVDENTISVNLTPINVYSNIYVVDYNNTRVTTNGNNGNYYFYTIYGERKDIPKLTVEF